MFLSITGRLFVEAFGGGRSLTDGQRNSARVGSAPHFAPAFLLSGDALRFRSAGFAGEFV